MAGLKDGAATGRPGAFRLALVGMAVIAVAVTVVSATRPWYVYGSDAFTARKNGWDTCPNLLLTRSFEVWFLLLTGLQVAGAAIVCRVRRVRFVGVALIVLAGVLGSRRAFHQLDAYEVGLECTGYEFNRLRPVVVATIAMLIAHGAMTLIALIAGFRKVAISVADPEQAPASPRSTTP